MERNKGSGRLAGLDGLRAVSIALVLLFHMTTLRGFPQWSWLRAVASRGQFGVEVFFVLSGFIITWLLVKEEDKSGKVDLRQFYVRRAFRILPPALIYLAVIGLLALAGWSTAGVSDLSIAALFARNLQWWTGSTDTGHFWSLAVEEQFYLTWPVLFVLLGKRVRVALLVTLIALYPLWRHEFYRLFPNPRITEFELHYEPLLMGCLLAVLRASVRGGELLSGRVFRSRWLLAGCTLMIVTLLGFDGRVSEKVHSIFPLVEYLCLALSINCLIQPGDTIVDRLLNARVVMWIGVLSYSLYLWQQPFCETGGSMELSAGLCLLPALGCAVTSYYFIEQPALRLRQRLGERKRRALITNATESWEESGGLAGIAR